MTREETKRIKEKFMDKLFSEYIDVDIIGDGEGIWEIVQDEIITPYEKQLEQVEREGKRLIIPASDLDRLVKSIENLMETVKRKYGLSQNTQTPTSSKKKI